MTFNQPAQDRRPSKRTTEEGGLHDWFATIIAAEDADRAVEVEAQDARTAASDFGNYPHITTRADAALASALAWAKSGSGRKGGEHSKCYKVLACSFARLYFTTLCRLSAHFCGSKDLTIKTFQARQGRDLGVRYRDLGHLIASNPNGF